MRTLILSALAATFWAAPALAQAAAAPPKTAVRPTEVNLQIKQDLGELVAKFDQTNASFTALPYVYGARVGYFGSNEWAPRFTANYAGTIRVNDVKVLERAGDDAKATVSYDLVFPPSGAEPMSPTEKALRDLMKNQQETLDFKLVKLSLVATPQIWQIVPPTAKPFPIDEGNKNVLWANISYHIAQQNSYEPDRTPVERSMTNLKQLGLGALQFTQDYDEIYAFEPRYTVQALSPCVASDLIFQVPDTNEIYTFNGNLSGSKLTISNMQEMQNSAQTVLFYEGQNETPIFRYDGKAAICFADGHVALVTPGEATKLIWKP